VPRGCHNLDSSLLRIVMIGEILCAPEDVLYTLASVFQDLGMLSEEELQPEVPPPLRRVK